MARRVGFVMVRVSFREASEGGGEGDEHGTAGHEDEGGEVFRDAGEAGRVGVRGRSHARGPAVSRRGRGEEEALRREGEGVSGKSEAQSGL